MRWKLLVIAPLAAAVVGAGLMVTLASFLPASYAQTRPPVWVTAAALILPLAAITFATIFVYRHTARRRKLQATLTALLSLLLTSCALFAADAIINRVKARTPVPQPQFKSASGF